MLIHDGTTCDYLSCCGDPAASNYDPDILPQLTFGCSYGQSAGMISLEVCNLSFACNFGEDADCEFDSCAGCTNASACNYDASATLSTSTCTYPLELYGNPNVNCAGECNNDANSNGICDEEEQVCPGDFNGDGLRGAADILVMLGAFGCQSECGDPDLNGDGMVAASDILVALSTFGLACPN